MMFLSTFIVLNLCILCASANDRYFVISADYNKDIASEILYRRGENIDTKYQPTWQSLDSRPLPSWYDEVKIGIFIHWGVFSVPSFGSEWFWNNWIGEKGSDKYHNFMKDRYPPKFTYQDFARDFTAEFFNASQWSEIFEASGAKYVVLTSKHHEGYTLWPSKYSFSWNSMDVGPQRDLIGELSTAIRKSTDLRFGLYHSMYEWYNPLYLRDKRNNFTTNQFVVDKTLPELLELVHNYNPEIIWSDGDWEAPDVYWKSKEFLAWLYNDSPVKDTVVVNDRWGQNIPCHHGGFYTCTDRYNPGVLLPHKWENAMTIDKQSWGFRRNAVLAEYLSLSELVKELVTTVSCGGNLLMNVGPTKDGIISPIFEERLRGMGNWLKINGEAIYNSRPWIVQNDTLANGVWYTQSADKKRIYAILLEWPESNNELQLGSLKISKDSRVFLLGHTTELKWKSTDHASIFLPPEAHKGQPAWVIKIQKT